MKTPSYTKKPKLSQNFLVDKNVRRKILEIADINPNDTILEIGPGKGFLTKKLVSLAKKVIAIEKDASLREYLNYKLNLYIDDFTTIDLDTIIASKSPVRIIANIPYHITQKIFYRIGEESHLFSDAILMVQKEVAKKYCQSPPKTYSTAILQFYFDIEFCFVVSKHCFSPVPNVDSAIIHLKKIKRPSIDKYALFSIIKKAFASKRKKITSSLSSLYDKNKLVQSASKIKGIRPEELSIEDWITLFYDLTNSF